MTDEPSRVRAAVVKIVDRGASRMRRGTEHGTHPIAADDLRARLPGFALVRAAPTALAGYAAHQFDLVRKP